MNENGRGKAVERYSRFSIASGTNQRIYCLNILEVKMEKTIQNLLLTSCFLFVVSYDSFTLGVDYDKRYKLYPEYESSSCVINFHSHSYSYGRRWERLGFVTFFICRFNCGRKELPAMFNIKRLKLPLKNISQAKNFEP